MAKKPVYVEVKAKYNEPTERLIRRFIKSVKKSGIMQEIRDRRYYRKPSDVRREEEKKDSKLLRRLTKSILINRRNRG